MSLTAYGRGLVKVLSEIATFSRAYNQLEMRIHPHCMTTANSIVFYSFFKTLVDQEVTVELKNDLTIKGILKSVDQFLNIKLDDITVLEENKYPHLVLTPSST